jgi:hypothetical protein
MGGINGWGCSWEGLLCCDRCPSVRRPTERDGHVGVRNLEARIVGDEATTSRDQDACPQSLDVVTRFAAYIAFGGILEA